MRLFGRHASLLISISLCFFCLTLTHILPSLLTKLHGYKFGAVNRAEVLVLKGLIVQVVTVLSAREYSDLSVEVTG